MSVHPLFSSVTGPRSGQDDAPTASDSRHDAVGATTRTTQQQVAVEMAKHWVNDAEARRAYLLTEYRDMDNQLALVCSTELGLASAVIKGLLEAFT